MPRKHRKPNVFDIERIERQRQPARRNKRRSDVSGSAKLTRQPELTASLAIQFVQMLHAGIPADKALVYFSVDYFNSCDKHARQAWLDRWCSDPLVLAATTAFLKGEWHTLEPDARLQCALDKHLAELAYLLYTNNYSDADAPTGKMNVAREALMAYMQEQSSGEETPFMRAVRELVDGKMGDAALGMPIVPTTPVAKKGN